MHIAIHPLTAQCRIMIPKLLGESVIGNLIHKTHLNSAINTSYCCNSASLA